jgi:hypothetical protein
MAAASRSLAPADGTEIIISREPPTDLGSLDVANLCLLPLIALRVGIQHGDGELHGAQVSGPFYVWSSPCTSSNSSSSNSSSSSSSSLVDKEDRSRSVHEIEPSGPGRALYPTRGLYRLVLQLSAGVDWR